MLFLDTRRALELDVIELEVEPGYPDACFVKAREVA